MAPDTISFARYGLLLTALAFFQTAAVGADLGRPVLLFDIEGGVVDWKGNPWGAGKAGAEPAAGARFGKGALRAVFEEAVKGGSVHPPNFPKETPWRGRTWGALSFWARGLGDAAQKCSLHISTSQRGTGFSASFTVQGKQWQRYEVTTARVWSSEKLSIDWAAMTGIGFVGYGNLAFEVDQIVLEPESRVVPYDADPIALCPWIDAAPALDGILNDPCCSLSGLITGFVDYQKGSPARDPTEVRLCHDAEHLYIGARLGLADISKLQATMTRRDAPIFQEDSIEFFFDPEGRSGNFRQLVASAIGTLMDLSRKEHLAFDADWQAKTSRDAQGWSVEAAIRLNSLGEIPQPGTTWRFNVGREIASTKEITCWSLTKGSFLNPDRWGQLLFVGPNLPASPGPPPVLLEYDYGNYGIRWAAPAGVKVSRLLGRVCGAGANSGWVTLDIAPGQATAEELLLLLRAPFPEPTLARWSFSALNDHGDVVAYAAGRFQVFPPAKEHPKPFLALLPNPKEIRSTKGRFALPSKARISSIGLTGPDSERVVGLLSAELKANYGLEWTDGKNGDIRLIRTDKAEDLAELFPSDRVAGFSALPEEGYLVEVTRKRVAIASKSARGLYYGAQTFLQAVALSTPVGERPVCPALSVRDFPDLPIRAVTMSFPNDRWGYPNDAPFEPAQFKDYLYRTLIRHKINTLVLIVGQAVKLDSHSELAGPAAWSKEQVRDVLDFARRHYLEVVPLQTVLGHAGWFTLRYKELWEDGDYHIACVSHPKTQEILTDVITEIADLFQPKSFHLAMDEAWWKTLDVPEEKRCKLCAGKPKSEIFASQAIRYYELLRKRGIRTMIWGDMLLAEHNGGPPYDTSKALEKLPRDIVLCNWSTALAPLSSKRFQEAGFKVIQSNSAGVNQEQAAWLIGNMMGCWSKAPWLVASKTDIHSYSFLPAFQAAEQGWSAGRNVRGNSWDLDREFLARVSESALMLLARPSAFAANGRPRPVSLAKVANLFTKGGDPASSERWFGLPPSDSLDNLPETVSVGGTAFTLLSGSGPNAVAFGTESRPAVVSVGSRASALALLYGCHLPEKQRDAFLDRFKQKEAIRGVWIGSVKVRFADGTAESIEMRYGLNVLPFKTPEGMLPYCYRATGRLLLSTVGMRGRDPRGRDAALYSLGWANPYPEKEITSLEMVSAGTEVPPFVVAVTYWPAKSGQ